jgi:hypothetical protein
MLHTLDSKLRTPRLRVSVKTDRRAHERTECSLVVCCQDPAGLRWRGRAIDLSPVGVCVVFWSTAAPPDIARLIFRYHQRNEILVPARVVHQRRQGNFWLVGCEFVRQLTGEEFAGLI